MIFFLLFLLGIALGVSLVVFSFPMNLVLPLAVVSFLLIVLSPFWVIIFLLGMTPFRILWLGGGIAPQELVYSVLFLFLLGFSFLREFLRKPSPKGSGWDTPMTLPLLGMGLVGAWGTLVAILHGHAFAHWTSDLNFILFFWLYFVVTVSLSGIEDLYKVLWPTFWITAAVVVWGMTKRIMEGMVMTGIAPGFPRGMAFSSTFFILCICLFLFSDPGRLRRKGLFLASCFFGLHQFLSFVRVTWISQIGTIGFILLVLPSPTKRRLLRWMGGIFVITSLVFTLSWILPTDNLVVKMPTYLMNRFLSIFTDVTGTGATIQTRYAEWKAALTQSAEHPWTGNGLGTQIQFIRYDFASHPLTTERYIHSSYIYYLLNTGPLGLAIFLWFILRAVKYGIRVYRGIAHADLKGLALGMTASLVFQIFSSIAGNELNNPSRTIWTGFFLGALAVIDREAKRREASGG